MKGWASASDVETAIPHRNVLDNFDHFEGRRYSKITEMDLREAVKRTDSWH
jgi:hypothetical protein